jgi:hypothetical protein
MRAHNSPQLRPHPHRSTTRTNVLSQNQGRVQSLPSTARTLRIDPAHTLEGCHLAPDPIHHILNDGARAGAYCAPNHPSNDIAAEGPAVMVFWCNSMLIYCVRVFSCKSPVSPLCTRSEINGNVQSSGYGGRTIPASIRTSCTVHTGSPLMIENV